jgi:hypothetical protein
VLGTYQGVREQSKDKGKLCYPPTIPGYTNDLSNNHLLKIRLQKYQAAKNKLQEAVEGKKIGLEKARYVNKT